VHVRRQYLLCKNSRGLGFDIQLESSPLGIAAIPDITLTLGNADQSLTQWDNQYRFLYAKLTATLVLWDPTTQQPASTDALVVFKGICNAPSEVTPTVLKVSASNRFNADLVLIPSSRISIYSQTIFPGEGKAGADVANPSRSKHRSIRMVAE